MRAIISIVKSTSRLGVESRPRRGLPISHVTPSRKASHVPSQLRCLRVYSTTNTLSLPPKDEESDRREQRESQTAGETAAGDIVSVLPIRSGTFKQSQKSKDIDGKDGKSGLDGSGTGGEEEAVSGFFGDIQDLGESVVDGIGSIVKEGL